MRRDIDNQLLKWKSDPLRMPLIVRGARQVGKSYSIEAFGKREFEELVVVNFEFEPYLASCFNSLNPEDIVKQLEIFTKKRVTPGKTLLFFDEVQLCPKALQSLRYFMEKAPELHVIAAGSLLEFVLDGEKLSFPVGRVQFLYMKPLSFMEYLEAIGEKGLADFVQSFPLKNGVESHIHEHILKFVREYFWIGGMPKIINTYIAKKSYQECLYQQRALLDVYALDFGKYASKTQNHYLQRLFQRAPEFVGKHFRYSKIDPESSNPSRDYKEALHKLKQANLIWPVQATDANGLPLRAEVDEKKFKILFLDVGLMQCALEVDPESFLPTPLIQIHEGALAEQFVGQELLAYMDCYLDRNLYFWENNSPSSSAEIDYVINMSGKIVPIEVKASMETRLKSMKQFLEKKNINMGVRISEHPLGLSQNILSVPFYLIQRLPTLLESGI